MKFYYVFDGGTVRIIGLFNNRDEKYASYMHGEGVIAWREHRVVQELKLSEINCNNPDGKKEVAALGACLGVSVVEKDRLNAGLAIRQGKIVVFQGFEYSKQNARNIERDKAYLLEKKGDHYRDGKLIKLKLINGLQKAKLFHYLLLKSGRISKFEYMRRLGRDVVSRLSSYVENLVESIVNPEKRKLKGWLIAVAYTLVVSVANWVGPAVAKVATEKYFPPVQKQVADTKQVNK